MSEARLTPDERQMLRSHADRAGMDGLFVAVERIIAGRIAQARHKGAAEAIGDVADWINDEPPMRKSAYVERLRSQAKALRGDA